MGWRRALRLAGASGNLTRLALAGCVPLLGCQQVFGLDDPQLTDVPACTPSSIIDRFETTPVCASWGFVVENQASVMSVSGDLVVMLKPGASSSPYGGCDATAPAAFTQAGIFVDVPAIATGVPEYTVFDVEWASGPGASKIIAAGGMLAFQRLGATVSMTSYDASMRWWRIRPRDDGAAVVAETSPDGKDWDTLGVDPVAPPTSILLKLRVGASSAQEAPTGARFGGLGVCPL